MTQTILAAVDDMFFASKIRATAEALSVEIGFPRTTEALLAKANEAKPSLILVDLHNQRLDPIDLARQLKSSHELSEVTRLGFFSHVDTNLKRTAEEAGYDRVIPRSVFARDLAEILAGKTVNDK